MFFILKNNHFLLSIDFLCPSLYDDQKQWKKETWREKKLKKKKNWILGWFTKISGEGNGYPPVQRVRHDLMTKQQQIGFC